MDATMASGRRLSSHQVLGSANLPSAYLTFTRQHPQRRNRKRSGLERVARHADQGREGVALRHAGGGPRNDGRPKHKCDLVRSTQIETEGTGIAHRFVLTDGRGPEMDGALSFRRSRCMCCGCPVCGSMAARHLPWATRSVEGGLADARRPPVSPVGYIYVSHSNALTRVGLVYKDLKKFRRCGAEWAGWVPSRVPSKIGSNKRKYRFTKPPKYQKPPGAQAST